jgi:hypothetical protein
MMRPANFKGENTQLNIILAIHMLICAYTSMDLVFYKGGHVLRNNVRRYNLFFLLVYRGFIVDAIFFVFQKYRSPE